MPADSMRYVISLLRLHLKALYRIGRVSIVLCNVCNRPLFVFGQFLSHRTIYQNQSTIRLSTIGSKTTVRDMQLEIGRRAAMPAITEMQWWCNMALPCVIYKPSPFFFTQFPCTCIHRLSSDPMEILASDWCNQQLLTDNDFRQTNATGVQTACAQHLWHERLQTT